MKNTARLALKRCKRNNNREPHAPMAAMTHPSPALLAQTATEFHNVVEDFRVKTLEIGSSAAKANNNTTKLRESQNKNLESRSFAVCHLGPSASARTSGLHVGTVLSNGFSIKYRLP